VSAAQAPLVRRLAAEALGTGLLATAVVGSGIAAARLSPGDRGLQLFENAAVTAAALAVIILLVGPVSGAHLNPLVSLADWWLGRRDHTGLDLADIAPYAAAQTLGGIAGTILANLMYDLTPATWSTTDRSAAHLWLSEVVATAGLIAVVFALARSGRAALSAATIGAYIGAYIGAAYFFTASTSFANPAITIARAFTNTFAGIAPASVPAYLLAQTVGAVLGLATVRLLYPDLAHTAAAAVVPHDAASPSPRQGPGPPERRTASRAEASAPARGPTFGDPDGVDQSRHAS
jgi:glycerol uptake facilitator-like aquaporin